MARRALSKILPVFPFLGATIAASAVFQFPQQAIAACVFTPTPGDDTFMCDSGTSAGGLSDTAGNNSLLLPDGGTGTVAGSVSFGAGADRIEVHSGTINGGVDQGAGADSFVISGGTVTGNVQQASGSDDFRMTGGQIQSLNQGDNLDTFFMSDGRIVDAFDDGDSAVMTGGRIGRVNMKLDDNLFDMSGGTIDRNLVTGFGNDTIILSNGTIGGNVSVSGGTDSVTVTGGSVGGNITLSFGNDTFAWNGGGIIYGAVDLGGDNDTATLTNLSNANIGATTQITGGDGIDSLTMNNVSTNGVGRFVNWERVDFTNDTELTFDGTLKVGDAATGTGTVNIDSSSTLYGGGANGGISSFNAAQLATVVNAGRIDLTNGGSSPTDTFTIHGNYTGNNALVFLNTSLGDDASPSDKLIFDGGAAGGSTGLDIINIGGTGATTTRDGIMVVQALNGGTTTTGAFALTDRVAAGAYEYYLFRGGVSANTGENWYLRSTLVNASGATSPQPGAAPDPGAVEPQPEAPETSASPPPLAHAAPPLPVDPNDPDPEDTSPAVQQSDAAPVSPPTPASSAPADPPPTTPPLSTTPAPVEGGSAAPPNPGATPVVGDVVPLYRKEVAADSAIPPAAYYLGLSTLGTFHERRGEQILLNGAGPLPATWGRAFGQHLDMKWDGTVTPGIDGDLYGLQAGQDLYGWDSDSGQIDRLGVFFGYAHLSGDIKGQALGWNGVNVGDIDISGTSVGGYWTHIGPQGWYVDGVLMGTWFNGDVSSNTGENIDIDGNAVTASLEGGYPIALVDQWTLEPQAQLIWQHLSLDRQKDSFSSISFDDDNATTGRIGLRLQGNYKTDAGTLQPYVKANLWHNFSSDQTLRFGADPITTQLKGTSLELGGGIVAQLSQKVSLFATADYTTNLGGERSHIVEGNIGLNVKW
jgi:outer membrane autotransporter protein